MKAGWDRTERGGSGAARRSSMSRNGRFDASPGGVSILGFPLAPDPCQFGDRPGRPKATPCFWDSEFADSEE